VEELVLRYEGRVSREALQAATALAGKAVGPDGCRGAD
jgi:hypothetical protein